MCFSLHFIISLATFCQASSHLQLGHWSLEACLNFQQYQGFQQNPGFVTWVTMCWLYTSDISSKYREGGTYFLSLAQSVDVKT